ncbi:hypothetical protein CANARDRAFT_10025 [[Candida] arabinofermentans NRRL YB-2248]|uniref:Amino acid transporter transmembrane domain-containing protein n=1 Tax=[Candida] arabinofermentans NRRL YB-2248 TaxID=983967 RepID=A0A1E4SU32_9ASCO|nr:hypothetical protein CANARDRAFT_10025 [[Candida] arabinofermentans NRRL YB-2248]
MSFQKEKDNEKSSTVDVTMLSDGDEVSEIKNPDLYTRLFYAQRYLETQYEEIKSEKLFGAFNTKIKNSLTINKLEPTSDDYPKLNTVEQTLRTAHWFSCAGLLTAEIMGAIVVPYSLGILGYVPGNLLLVFLFFLTLLSGGVIWWLFLLLDSPEFPVRTFSDIAFVIGGEYCRQAVTFLQIVGMILTTAGAVLASAQTIILIRTERVCWIGIVLLIAGTQAIVGHIKQLSNLGKICLFVSFTNYISLFVQMGYMGKPNYANALSLLGLEEAPVMKYAFTPNQPLIDRVVGASNIAYVFAGSIVFPEIISEMRRPWEFWKSLLVAEGCILVIYLLFGNYVYSKQGQFSLTPAVFGISDEKALKGLCLITFLTGFIQSVFYGHISCKIAFKNYMPMLFKNLDLSTKRGTFLWSATVLTIWICVFIIAAGVPQVSAVGSFTSALTMIPLTFCFPFIFQIWGLFVTANASNIDSFDCSTLTVIQKPQTFMVKISTGFRHHWFLSTLYLGLGLGALAFAGLGIYSSVEYMKVLFAISSATSFSCVSPV